MSRLNLIAGVCLAVALCATPARAGDPKPPVMDEKAIAEAMAKMGAVGENHKLLASLVGEWTSATKMWMAPGQPPEETQGSVVNAMVMGGRYLHSMHKGTVMGMPFEGVSLTGYNNLAGQFEATWVDSMSTGIFYQTGSYDAAARTLTYHAEMHDPMAPGTMLKVRTTLRLVDADTYLFEWYETHGGREVRTMEVTYKRKK